MAISRARLELCRAFLDDCYSVHGTRGDLWSNENTVENYATPESQATYAVMYFAKYVGCWRYIRELVEGEHGVGSRPVFSIGAGPLFCLLGWFFDSPPDAGVRVTALDYLKWEGIRQLPSHQALVSDVLGGISYPSGYYFPEIKSPQCARFRGGRFLDPMQLPEGSIVLLPMVLNHLVGQQAPVDDTASLRDWFHVLQTRCHLIVVVDMPCWVGGNKDTTAFWRSVGDLFGVAGRPQNLNFAHKSGEFSPCYGDRFLSWRPECDRRTGIASTSFAEVAGCIFDQAAGWRWLES